MNLINKKAVFCQVCGECLGEYRENYAQEHLQKHPSHNDFFVKMIIDPLILDNPDEWFRKKKQPSVSWKNTENLNLFQQPKSNKDKTTDNETEPEITPTKTEILV